MVVLAKLGGAGGMGNQLEVLFARAGTQLRFASLYGEKVNQLGVLALAFEVRKERIRKKSGVRDIYIYK